MQEATVLTGPGSSLLERPVKSMTYVEGDWLTELSESMPISSQLAPGHPATLHPPQPANKLTPANVRDVRDKALWAARRS